MKGTYHWSRRHRYLAKRLGLVKVARAIHDRCGPWIIPTASAYYALKAAGFFDAHERPTVTTGDPYR